MCSRVAGTPVFVHGDASGTFLDDLLGWTISDRLRPLIGHPPLHDLSSPYGLICDPPDSFLSVSFSSFWAFAAFLLALGAGFSFWFSRKAALASLAAALVVSLADTGIRVAARLDRGGPLDHEMMIAGLPAQLAANLLFQILLPFACAYLLDRLGSAVRKLLVDNLPWLRG
jgi:hypothetical protein